MAEPTTSELEREYRLWSDQEIREHRHACLQVAREQREWGDRQTSMYATIARKSAGRYARELLRRDAERGAK